MLFHRFLFSKRSGSLVRTIAWLCLSGIVIGVAALIVVMSVMNGFNNSIRGKLVGLEPHLVVRNVTVDSLTDFLSRHPEIRAQDFETQDVILRTYDGLFSGAVAQGLAQEDLQRFVETVSERKKTSQEDLALGDMEKNGIIVGADLARTLALFEGDLITVIPPESLLLPPGEVPHVSKAKIHSIITTEIPELDSTALYYVKGGALSAYENVSKQNGVEMFLPEPTDFEDEYNELKAQGLEVQSWQERNAALFFALKMEKAIMAVFLSLSALIASFSIFSLMVLLLAQKSQDIGVMMSMGLSRAKARQIFIGLGQCLSWSGLGGGLILGTVISFYLQWYPLRVLPEDVYYDSAISARVDGQQILWVVLGCFVVSVFASVLPVLRQVSMTPAEAFRVQRSS